MPDYGLHADCGLPPDYSRPRIAGLRIILGPGKVCISPDQEKIEVHVVGREKLTNLFEGVNEVEEQYCEGGPRVTPFTNTGTFLIATDCGAKGEGVDDATVYHNLVGNFINGIERVTSATGVKSRIAVVTTKQEAEENPRQLNHLVEAPKPTSAF